MYPLFLLPVSLIPMSYILLFLIPISLMSPYILYFSVLYPLFLLPISLMSPSYILYFSFSSSYLLDIFVLCPLFLCIYLVSFFSLFSRALRHRNIANGSPGDTFRMKGDKTLINKQVRIPSLLIPEIGAYHASRRKDKSFPSIFSVGGGDWGSFFYYCEDNPEIYVQL